MMLLVKFSRMISLVYVTGQESFNTSLRAEVRVKSQTC